MARHYVDECVTCTEKEVSLAILRLIENEKMVVEGGGASGLAALLPGAKLDRPELKGKNIVVPLCGGKLILQSWDVYWSVDWPRTIV